MKTASIIGSIVIGLLVGVLIIQIINDGFSPVWQGIVQKTLNVWHAIDNGVTAVINWIFDQLSLALHAIGRFLGGPYVPETMRN